MYVYMHVCVYIIYIHVCMYHACACMYICTYNCKVDLIGLIHALVLSSSYVLIGTYSFLILHGIIRDI